MNTRRSENNDRSEGNKGLLDSLHIEQEKRKPSFSREKRKKKHAIDTPPLLGRGGKSRTSST